MRKYLRVTAISIALMSMAGLAACNTVHGMGQDVQAGGSAVSSAAAETQASMQNGPAPTMSDASYAGDTMAPDARISIANARARALSERPGDVTSQSLQRREGGSGLRYSFDIRSDNITYEVGVDAGSGAILENRREG